MAHKAISSIREMPGFDPEANAAIVRQSIARMTNETDSSEKVRAWEWSLLTISLAALAVIYGLHKSPWPPMMTIKHYVSLVTCDTARSVGGQGCWYRRDDGKDHLARGTRQDSEPIEQWKLR